VILVDANLLVYAHDAAAPEHPLARAWFEQVINGSARVGLPWPSLLAFVRLVSNQAIVRHPVAPAVAWQRAGQWLARDNVWLPLPGPAHPEVLARLLGDGRVTSRMVPDAHLAALAIEHGLTLCSSDGDFARFAGLRWENPLAA
jgi:toxin-antitoxin system PIN domain toxin